MLGYLELVLVGAAGEIPDPAVDFLTKANRSAKTLLDLVNDILDLSKLAAGKMDVVLQPCTISELAEGAVTTMQPMADKIGVPLTVELAGNLPLLHTDDSESSKFWSTCCQTR